MMKHNSKAVSLIEVVIAVVLASLIIIGLMNLFSSGMKGSTKGLAHQANMETASILMAQIEYDLLRASKIKSPEGNKNDDCASWLFSDATTSSEKVTPLTVNYTKDANGISRKVIDENNKTISNTVFAKNHNFNISFLHLAFNTKIESQKKHGMWVELTISSKDKKTDIAESFTLKRLILLRSVNID